MGLAIGERFGSYEVVELIGVGGMGEVYRARDTRLHRDVALKVLPDTSRVDPAALQRLEREARLLAALNHPNIATLYGLESKGDVHALVMEVVDGETLDDRLRGAARGKLTLHEAQHIALQLADALDTAHERGIVHLDLKPANIKIRADGTVKVLDFGIAKVFEAQSSDPRDVTLTAKSMQPAIVGTPSYMSPEQATGGAIDQRADIWAFGCVLYEMVTGDRAFAADTSSATLAQVIEREPDWTKVGAAVPHGLRVLLRQCLEKNPRKRRRDCGDVRLDLEQLAAEPRVAAAPRRNLWMPATALLALTAIGLLAIQVLPTESAPGVQAVRFAVSPPPGGAFATSLFAGSGAPVGGAISPDGLRLAFTARDAGGTIHLYVRPLDSLEARALPGTEDAALPFWSPDSAALGFFARGQLRRVDATGTAQPQALCAVTRGQGGTWSNSGTIVFGADLRSSLRRVSATGADCANLTTLAASERAHRFPHFLSDGEHFVYHVDAALADDGGIFVAALGTPTGQRLLAADSAASAPQRLLFVRQGTLFAQAFDTSSLELRGDPVAIAPGVSAEGSAPAFSASNTGVLTYRTGPADSDEQQLAWFDRTGTRLGVIGAPGTYRGIDLSPDGTRIAVHNHQSNGGDVWVIEPQGTATRITLAPAQDNSSPIWSPDGQRLAYGSLRDGKWGLYTKAANGEGAEQLFIESETPKIPASWSPDGAHLAYWNYDRGTHQWVLPLKDSSSAKQLLAETATYDGHSQISPDGRWIAYMSSLTGRPEVYVRAFPTGEGARQVSTNGGVTPRWRLDGTELYYMTGYDHGTLMAVPVETNGDALTFGVAEALFPVDMAIVPHSTLVPNFHTYAVTRDGQRFVLPLPVSTLRSGTSAAAITVALNWSASLD